ncbi:sulfite exporter TauE/SafE family protein [Hydrogenobaculum acidophilum]
MIHITLFQYILSIVSGLFVGLILSLIGGGGSILAVPLLLYFVGLDNGKLSPELDNKVKHLAIGSTALAVGINAFINSLFHFRHGNVSLKEGFIFAIPGIIGSFFGAYAGASLRGKDLLVAFGFMMIAIAFYVLSTKEKKEFHKESISGNPFLIALSGLFVGILSGFFGIGGGFLIVPALLFSTNLSTIKAIGTSLISVGMFGITTALVYAMKNEVSVLIAVCYLIGGFVGGFIGVKIARRLNAKNLKVFYAFAVILVGIYIIYKNIR